jgi:hypothetical protein
VDGSQTPDFALHRVSPLTSGRQQRHLAFISEYTSQLVYLPGTSNVVADALSHPAAAIADRSPLDLKDMALRQILCPQVQSLCSSPGLRIITQKVGDLDLISNSSTGTFRPLVPRDLRRQVFEHLHGTTHPGRQATPRLISSRYICKGLSTDVTAWAKACLGCQRAKVHRHVQVPTQNIPIPTRCFSHINVDLVGPLPVSKDFTYLFTIIDRTSRWPVQPRVQGRPPAAVRFRDFPPPGAEAARRVHFDPQQPAEPHREPFSPGTPPGVFARPAAVPPPHYGIGLMYRPARLHMLAGRYGNPKLKSALSHRRGLIIWPTYISPVMGTIRTK